MNFEIVKTCQSCEDKGFVEVKLDDSSFVYRCECEAGKKYSGLPFRDGTYESKKQTTTKSFKKNKPPEVLWRLKKRFFARFADLRRSDVT
jgi:hypothetical protein